MSEPFVLKSDDPVIQTLQFKPYRSIVQRRVQPFTPAPNEPQTQEVITPWGISMQITKGDLLISELDNPNDSWPIKADIFDETYLMVAPGFCVKRAVTLLVPLVDVTGDPNRLVEIHTLEGTETVRAGDFFLAKGVKNEIWPYPYAKAAETMRPAE